MTYGPTAGSRRLAGDQRALADVADAAADQGRVAVVAVGDSGVPSSMAPRHRGQSVDGAIGDDGHEGAGPGLAPPLDADRDHGLVRGAASRFPPWRRARHTPRRFRRPAQELVGSPGEPRSRSCGAGSRRLVAVEPEIALELERRDPLLVARQEEDRHEPLSQRDAGAVEDRAGGDRDLMPALAALPQPARASRSEAPFAWHRGQRKPFGQRTSRR